VAEPNEHVGRSNLLVTSGLVTMTTDRIPQSVKEEIYTLIFAILWISIYVSDFPNLFVKKLTDHLTS
jgi:hypothetical protein